MVQPDPLYDLKSKRKFGPHNVLYGTLYTFMHTRMCNKFTYLLNKDLPQNYIVFIHSQLQPYVSYFHDLSALTRPELSSVLFLLVIVLYSFLLKCLDFAAHW